MTLVTIEKNKLIELVEISILFSKEEDDDYNGDEVTNEDIEKEISRISKPNRTINPGDLWQHSIKRGIYKIVAIASPSIKKEEIQEKNYFKLHGYSECNNQTLCNLLILYTDGYSSVCNMDLNKSLVFYTNIETTESWALSEEEFLGLGKDGKNRFNKLQEIM